MRSLQITGPDSFDIIETERPTCAPDEVLIEMKACAICNQHDAAILSGRGHGVKRNYPLPPGFPGHEGAGVVVEKGDAVTGLSVGDRVATSGIGGPPLYSEYVTRKQDTVARFGESVDFPHAAPMELFGCVHRAFTLTNDIRGRRVGVAGLGPGGQAAVALARAYGAREVVGFELQESRRNTALKMGANAVVDAAEFVGAHEVGEKLIRGEALKAEEQPVAEAIRKHQCEVVFECSGNPRSLETSFLLAGKELTIFGYTEESARANPAVWFSKELRIQASKILSMDDLRAVTGLLEKGLITTQPIVTDVIAFKEYGAGLERLRKGEAIKVALVWS